MDSKIILAILIVALIGIVAATYQNETGNLIESLSNVAVEEESPEGATDILDSNLGSNSEDSIKLDEDVVKSDNTAPKKTTNKKTTTNTKTANNNNNGRSNTNNPSGNSNNITSSAGNNNNPSNTSSNSNPSNTSNSIRPNSTNSSTNQSNVQRQKISSLEAKQIATQKLPDKYSKAVASTPQLYDNSYEVTFYLDGKAIGYYEVDAYTGAITGGAFNDEVPSPETNSSVSD